MTEKVRPSDDLSEEPAKSVLRRVRQSELNAYFRCGEQHRRAWINGEVIPPGIALIKGQIGHKVAEHNFKHKLDHVEDAPLSDLMDLASTELQSKFSSGVTLTQDEASAGIGATKALLTDRMHGITRHLRAHVMPPIMPEIVEEHVVLAVPSAGVELAGTIDLADTEKVLRDFKFSRRRRNQSEADSSDQLSLYAVLYESLTGHYPRKLALEVIRDTGRVIDNQTIETTRDERDREVIATRIEAFMGAIGAGIALPAEPGSWVCSAKWCGFFRSCRYVNAERVAAQDDV